ncbi:MAG: transposase [Bacteroidota bacterium]
MQLSDCGRIAEQCWLEIPVHFPHVSLDEFVIMPNHVHGIIVINEMDNNMVVETRHAVSLQLLQSLQPLRQSDIAQNHPIERFGKPRRGTLSTIIRSYKSAVTKQINEMRKTKGLTIWQSRYHDRVIREDEGLNRIRQYIYENPLKWAMDDENPDKL